MTERRHYRFVPVVILLAASAMLLSGGVPGILQAIRRAAGAPPPPRPARWKRLLAFALVLAAFAIAVV